MLIMEVEKMGMNESLTKMFDLASGTKDHLLLNAVIDVKKDMIDLLEENHQLRTENHELKNQNIISSELRMIRNAYYLGKDLAGPYCSVCWDKDKQLIRMHVYKRRTKYCNTVQLDCGVCKNSFLTGDTIPSDEMPEDTLRKMLEEFMASCNERDKNEIV